MFFVQTLSYMHCIIIYGLTAVHPYVVISVVLPQRIFSFYCPPGVYYFQITAQHPGRSLITVLGKVGKDSSNTGNRLSKLPEMSLCQATSGDSFWVIRSSLC